MCAQKGRFSAVTQSHTAFTLFPPLPLDQYKQEGRKAITLEVLEVTVVLVGTSAPESGLVGWSGFSTPSP